VSLTARQIFVLALSGQFGWKRPNLVWQSGNAIDNAISCLTGEMKIPRTIAEKILKEKYKTAINDKCEHLSRETAAT
jgi:hypothetical protein